MNREEAISLARTHAVRLPGDDAHAYQPTPKEVFDWHPHEWVITAIQAAAAREHGVTFRQLRTANAARLPQFKNCHGQPAHAKPDGSDWNPAQWLQALLGELGEYASLRVAYEAGYIGRAEYQAKAADELADVQTYLDLLAQRCYDDMDKGAASDMAQVLQLLVSSLGEYANARKKYERGDLNWEQFDDFRKNMLTGASNKLDILRNGANRPPSPVTWPHEQGVELAAALPSKFNRISERVGCEVKL